MTTRVSGARAAARALAAAACLALTAGCDNSGGNNALTGPSPQLTTETFTGGFDTGGSAFHVFTVAVAGEVDIDLTAAGPPSTIFMGLGVGAPQNGTCALFTGGSVSTPAGAIPQLVGTAGAGQYCVAVFDVGNIAAPITYTVTVAHP